MQKENIFRVLTTLLCHLIVSSGSDLKDVTKQIFGDNLDYLPVAFGDFNSDKLTDVFVIDQQKSKISILLAIPDSISSVLSSHTYFLFPSQVKDKKKLKLECPIDFGEIVSLIPGDFDGDGGMDIFVTVKNDDDLGFYDGFVMWGDHDEVSGRHALICNTKSNMKGWFNNITISSHPLVIDANADYVADIFAEEKSGTNSSRCIWTYSANRKDKPEKQCWNTEEIVEMRVPHSNSYIDVNEDGNSDIIVTTKTHFEIWKNMGNKEGATFSFVKNVKYPGDCNSDDTKCKIGQFAFADFNLDGKLDVVFPMCFDSDCLNSTIFFGTLKDIWDAKDSDVYFRQMTIDLRNQRLAFDEEDSLYGPLTPRIGDINLDGYPDLLVRLKDPVSLKTNTHLLLNFAVDHENEVIKSNLKRGFVLQEEIMPKDLQSSILATFYDLYENGNEDILIVQKLKDGKYQIGALTNSTQDSDAYFVKVIVLTGRCFKSCKNLDDSINNDIKVPYGTNTPGQTICYKTQRPGIGEIESCAPQLSQTGHNALQLPYTIFGLGLAPNFLDYMFVNVTNATDSSRSHTWSQIIPNSQMYVIPFPSDQPAHWEAKLFVTPSRGIVLTGIALVGTCGLIMLIIVFLHLRERKADLREKLQEAHRFHFDAM